jgi:hypothetical protein
LLKRATQRGRGIRLREGRRSPRRQNGSEGVDDLIGLGDPDSGS